MVCQEQIYKKIMIFKKSVKIMEYEIKKKIHITCPHCEKPIETKVEMELEIEEKKKYKDKKSKKEKKKSKK